ncbi:MAG TPA: protein DA1, partial [Chroococcales cyanobacterium]
MIKKTLLFLLFLSFIFLASPALAGPLCAACGLEIKGSYTEALGHAYHPEHFRCGLCGGVLGRQFFPKDGVPYHKECYLEKFAIRCSICQRPIEGKYMQDYWGDRFHPEHLNNHPFCHYCNRPITQDNSKGGFRIADGRILCGLCAKNAVMDQKTAEKYAREARNLLKSWGLLLPQEKIPVILVERDRLSGSAFGAGDVLGRICNVVSGKKKSINSIFMLYGLPREAYMGAIVHELMHGWIFFNTDLRHSPPLEEGACNYLSYLYHHYRGESAASYFEYCLEKNENSVYGEGFRRVKAIAASQGSNAVLELLKKNEDFPPG